MGENDLSSYKMERQKGRDRRTDCCEKQETNILIFTAPRQDAKSLAESQDQLFNQDLHWRYYNYSTSRSEHCSGRISTTAQTVQVSSIIRVAGELANAMRTLMPVDQAKILITAIMAKLREKNRTVQTTVTDTLTAFQHILPIEFYIDEQVSNHDANNFREKPPQYRLCYLQWLITALNHPSVSRNSVLKIAKQLSKKSCAANYSTAAILGIDQIDDTQAPVRAAAGTLLMKASEVNNAMVVRAIDGLPAKKRGTAREAIARLTGAQDQARKSNQPGSPVDDLRVNVGQTRSPGGMNSQPRNSVITDSGIKSLPTGKQPAQTRPERISVVVHEPELRKDPNDLISQHVPFSRHQVDDLSLIMILRLG